MWKSTLWDRALKGNEHDGHTGLSYEKRERGESILGNQKRYSMGQNKDTIVYLYSEELSDHLAWLPQVNYYQELVKSKVKVSTKFIDLLSPSYPNLDFFDVKEYYGPEGFNIPKAMGPGREKLVIIGKDLGPNTFAVDSENKPKAHSYNLEFTKEGNLKHTKQDRITRAFRSGFVKTKPEPKNRQVLAAARLGLKAHIECVPNLKIKLLEKPTTLPYVTVSINGNESWNGWQKVVDYLIAVGYVVVTVDYESNGIKRALNSCGRFALESKASIIKQAEFHVGINNDMSWLAWSLSKPTLVVTAELPEWENKAFYMIDDSNMIENIEAEEVNSAIDIIMDKIDDGTLN